MGRAWQTAENMCCSTINKSVELIATGNQMATTRRTGLGVIGNGQSLADMGNVISSSSMKALADPENHTMTEIISVYVYANISV